MSNLAVVVSHSVGNFDHWKRVFDGHQGARKAAGVLGHHLNRGADDPNVIHIFMPVTDRARVEAFMAGEDLRETMSRGSVTSPPTVTWLERVSADYVADRPTAAALIRHDVADFDAWKKVYDEVDGLRRQAGVIGHAVNRVVGTRAVLIYHQAETRAALEAFFASGDLKAAMMRGGVSSAPEFQHVQALSGALY